MYPRAHGDAAGDDLQMEGLLDNLVGQLLSKDVMHEPMKHLHAEFPKYLATHGDKLSSEERKRYLEQQSLVAAVERFVAQHCPHAANRPCGSPRGPTFRSAAVQLPRSARHPTRGSIRLISTDMPGLCAGGRGTRRSPSQSTDDHILGIPARAKFWN